MNPTRVLVVDDEPQITRVLRRALSAIGYEVQTAADGAEALEIFQQWTPDILITDIAMPNFAGLELCRKIRKVSKLPIIVLSVKGDEKIKVEALDIGADDYITKPFGMEELFARIRAALRRGLLSSRDYGNDFVVGDFSIDQTTRTIKLKGQKLQLTPKEYELLLYLLKNSGKVLTHRILLGAVWGGELVGQGEYLRVFIGQLRKKIGSEYIITEPWVGYRLNPEV